MNVSINISLVINNASLPKLSIKMGVDLVFTRMYLA